MTRSDLQLEVSEAGALSGDRTRLGDGAPALVEHARAFLAGAEPEASGWWCCRAGGWHFARFCALRASHGSRVKVTLTPADLPSGLTSRELDVLTLLSMGLTNRQICDELVTSVRTVSSQVAAVLSKLGHETRAGAAAEAIASSTFRLPIPVRSPQEPVPLSPLEARLPRRRTRRPPSLAPVRIGAIVPGEGASRGDGEGMIRGATLAVDEVNLRGGIGGRRLEHLAVEADINSSEGFEQALVSLLSSGVDAITFGYLLERERESLWTLIGECGIPILHGMTSRRWVDRVKADPDTFANVFQVCPTEDSYLRGMSDTLRGLIDQGRWTPRNNRLEILGSGRSFDAALSLEAIDAELGRDWQVERTDGALSSAPVMDRLEVTLPAVALVVEPEPDLLASFQRELAARKLPILVYQLYTPSMPEYLATVGEAAEGAVWSTVAGTYGDALGARFAGRYQRAYGTLPGRSHSGIAYDEVSLLTEAWSAVGHPGDYASIMPRLRRTPVRGVNGVYYFDHLGQHGLGWPYDTPDPALGQAHLVLQVQQGQHRIIGPSPYAEAAFRLPVWF